MVSVVLPIFNGAATIKQAIDSILNQTLQDIELIVVDDGSSDNCSELVNNYRDDRIRYFSRDHKGLASSLNFGVKKCQGKYIARMDADDISHKNRLALQVNYIENNEDIDLIATAVRFKGPKDSKGLLNYVNWQNSLVNHEEIFANRFVDSPIIHPSIMTRRSAFERYGYYSEEDVPEDYELWLRWLQNGASFQKLEEELLVWIDSPSRLTRLHPNYSKERFFHIKAKYFSIWFLSEYGDTKPDIWIIGSGRLVFQRTNWLSHYGLDIKGFVDVKSRLSSTRKIIGYDELSTLANPFFLSYVNDRSGRVKVRDFLKMSGLSEGTHFYMMA